MGCFPSSSKPKQSATPGKKANGAAPAKGAKQGPGGKNVKSVPAKKGPATKPAKQNAPGAKAGVGGANKVFFYDKNKPHYGFTNFSNHPVIYGGLAYPTSEHLFQSLKFIPHRADISDLIRNCKTSADALSEATRHKKHQRADWFRVNIQMMDEVLLHKFRQHPALKAELLGTGNAELVEDSHRDAFWGVGKNGKGRNELGKALVRLRERFRQGLV